MKTKKTKISKKKLWVVYTQDLQYNFCGLGETKAEARQAIWDEIKRTNSLPPLALEMKMTMSDFFDNYGGPSHHLAIGEAESE